MKWITWRQSEVCVQPWCNWQCHMIFLNTTNSQIVIFPARTLWAEHKSVWIFKIGSVVQKINMFLCPKIGPEVGKQRQTRKCDKSDGTIKILKMVVLGFLFKRYKSYHHEIWLHTGKKNAESIYNVKKKVSYQRSELICINCTIMSTFFHQSCKNSKQMLNDTAN